jgi:hypothetical protein
MEMHHADSTQSYEMCWARAELSGADIDERMVSDDGFDGGEIDEVDEKSD